MLALSLRDGASAALAAMPERVQGALAAKANALAAELEAKVQQKLAGEVLNARSGALARSIVATIEVDLPAVTMPERSYLRSSLAEMADEIREELMIAVANAAQ